MPCSPWRGDTRRGGSGRCRLVARSAGDWRAFLHCPRSRVSEGVQFGGNVACLGRAGPLENLVRLPKARLRVGGAAGGQGAPAQAGQRMGFIPATADLAGQVQGAPVTGPGRRQVAADPVQRPCLVERLSLTFPVAEVAVEAQGFFQDLGCARVVPGQPPLRPQVAEDSGLASPVVELAVEAQRFFQGLGCARVVPGQPPQRPQVAEGVGLAAPFAEATG